MPRDTAEFQFGLSSMTTAVIRLVSMNNTNESQFSSQHINVAVNSRNAESCHGK